MENSILNTVKRLVGVSPGYSAFDEDILVHINSAFSSLSQLGIGPIGGYSIEDDGAEWGSITVSEEQLQMVKAYIGFKVRLAFDPPPTSFAITALEKQISELEWRLNLFREPDRDVPEEEVTEDE